MSEDFLPLGFAHIGVLSKSLHFLGDKLLAMSWTERPGTEPTTLCGGSGRTGLPSARAGGNRPRAGSQFHRDVQALRGAAPAPTDTHFSLQREGGGRQHRLVQTVGEEEHDGAGTPEKLVVFPDSQTLKTNFWLPKGKDGGRDGLGFGISIGTLSCVE